MNCTCPVGDPRNVIAELIAALSAAEVRVETLQRENEQLRYLLGRGLNLVNRLAEERTALRQANMGYVANMIDREVGLAIEMGFASTGAPVVAAVPGKPQPTEEER